jgi:hypothetical protein
MIPDSLYPIPEIKTKPKDYLIGLIVAYMVGFIFAVYQIIRNTTDILLRAVSKRYRAKQELEFIVALYTWLKDGSAQVIHNDY